MTYTVNETHLLAWRIRSYNRLRSSKVIDLGVNRKRICDFLLAIKVSLDVSPIVFEILTFKARKWLVFHSSLVWQPRFGERVRISGWNLLPQKLERWGYHGENFMILTSTVFDWSTRVTDRQTDERYHIARQAGGNRYSDKLKPTTQVWFSVFQVHVKVCNTNIARLNG